MSAIIETFNSLLQLAVENAASDIHVKSNKPAHLRLHGKLEVVDMDPLTPEQIQEFLETAMPASFYEDWKQNGQIDFSYDLNELGLGRFRVNGFYQRGTPSVVFRHVKDTPPTFEDLNHEPETFKKLAEAQDGIVLVCGPTGSGKSSTLAAILEYINVTFDRHIVTLEDPIEFNYTDKKSIFNQREIGLDAPDFELGLKAVLRQDPDIILIGEMRDRATFETALHASETGHLVFGTLHAGSAQQAVQRLFEFFPVDQQESMRRQIAIGLRATITQRLVPKIEGEGRIPAVEIFAVDSLGRKVIEEGAFQKIPAVIEASEEVGSKTFNQDLYRLVKAGLIGRQDALAYSPNPKALEMNLKGIFLSQGGIVG
jgi:twitching motility protein PilT